MGEKFLSLGEVAKRLGVAPYRIAYAIVNGRVADCEHWFVGRRAFSESEIQRLAEYFSPSPPDSPDESGPT
jgi:hypothetical protein